VRSTGVLCGQRFGEVGWPECWFSENTTVPPSTAAVASPATKRKLTWSQFCVFAVNHQGNGAQTGTNPHAAQIARGTADSCFCSVASGDSGSRRGSWKNQSGERNRALPPSLQYELKEVTPRRYIALCRKSLPCIRFLCGATGFRRCPARVAGRCCASTGRSNVVQQ
jgi:hypothetical protein